MSQWIILCPNCDKEFRIQAEDIPEKCPHCGYEGDFEIVDEDEGE